MDLVQRVSKKFKINLQESDIGFVDVVVETPTENQIVRVNSVENIETVVLVGWLLKP